MSTVKNKVIVVIDGARAPGRGLIRAVVESNDEFAARAITRSQVSEEGRYLAARGAEVVVAEMGDQASLRQAFEGAYGAFYMLLPGQHPGPEKKLAEAKSMALAAKDAALQHVIWATLEDPSPAPLITEDEETPTFTDGGSRRKFEAGTETAKLFADLGVPITRLQAAGHASLANGKWAEEIGKIAHTIFRNRDLIGKTVSISAGQPAAALAPSSREAPIAPPPQDRRALYVVGAAALLLVVFVAVGMKSLSGAHKAEVPIAVPATGEVLPVRPRPPAGNPQGPPVPPVAPSVAPSVAPVQPERAPIAPVLVPRPPTGKPSQKVVPPKRVAIVRKRGGSEGQQAIASTRRPSAPDTPAEAALPAPGRPAGASGEPEANPAGEAPIASSVPRFPPRPAEVAPPPPPGTVSTRAIAATVRTHAPEVQECYERALMDGIPLHGRLTVTAQLDPGGRVLSVSPSSSTIEGGARLRRCVVDAFKSWTFPAPAGGVKGNITYSFSFE